MNIPLYLVTITLLSPPTAMAAISASPISFCVYGSSSTKTKDKYVEASFALGSEIAKRGHVCVNGGGCNGCMGAMNRGVRSEKGSVIGVIHQVGCPLFDTFTFTPFRITPVIECNADVCRGRGQRFFDHRYDCFYRR